MKYKVKASTMIETVVIRTEQLCDFDEIRTIP